MRNFDLKFCGVSARIIQDKKKSLLGAGTNDVKEIIA